MDLKRISDLIHLLRSSYDPSFEKEACFQIFSDQKSLIFDQAFETQVASLTFPDLIQLLTSTIDTNDRYLEINRSGEWLTFLAATLQDRPILSCIIQDSDEIEFTFDDERILNLPETYLEHISFFQVEPENNLANILAALRELDPEIENTIVLLPVVEDYRLHLLYLLTIVPFLGESALILTPGANYPWINQANQDLTDLYPQIKLILDLSLKNSRLGDRLEGVQILGVGDYWVNFDESHIHFNPHFLRNLREKAFNDCFSCLGLDDYVSYQQHIQKVLQDAVNYHQQGDREQAKFLYQKILQQDINQDLAWANLSTIAFDENDRDTAFQFLHIAAHINPENDLHWRNIGLLYKRSRDFRQSIYFFQKALQVNENLPLNYLNLAKVFEQANRVEDAHAILQKGRERFPLDLVLLIKQLLLKPLIYKNSDQITTVHNKIIDNLQRILQQLNTEIDLVAQLTSSQVNEIFEALDLAYFAYQGLDLVTIAKPIAEIISYLLGVTQPELRSLMNTRWKFSDSSPIRFDLDQPKDSRKIRIGYLGTCLRDHVIGYLSRGWIQYHDRSQFEVFCYSINSKDSPEDSIVATFKQYSDRFYQFNYGGLNVFQKILNDKIDILVFLDLNVGTPITHYALLRFAPVQCGFWGNPMTSGSPQIDYFLSSQFMESWEAQNHYTEKLVYLPRFASALIPEKMEIPEICAGEFDLKNDRITYLFTQTLLKHLPQYDYIFAAIAQQVTQAEFIFLAQPDEYLAQAFLDRLGLVFAEYNLDMKQYCRLLPVMPKPKFYALQSLVNVALDSLGWSGGVTTLDAITCNLPVVTYPGEFMRGRHSYGILQLLGVTETIAHSEQEYIEIAVQLGVDRIWNNRIREKIKQNKTKLYGDQSCIQGLETFYRSLFPVRLKF